MENRDSSTQRENVRVCFVMLHYAPDSARLDLTRYLNRTPIHRELPQAMAKRGYDVHLVHLWPYDASFMDRGVRFHFVAESKLNQGISSVSGVLRSGDAAAYQPARRAIELIRSLRPDVIHFHGCTLNLNLFLLIRALERTYPPIVLHYHGGYPSRNRLARALQRHSFDRVDRFCFSTRAHAKSFIDAGMLRDPSRVVELMETSSAFVPRDRWRARQVTGMTGQPVILSVGRLHPIKDPLVMMDGFARVLREWPKAELYLYYTSDELLSDVRRFVACHPGLDSHVHLRGRAEPEAMEAIYNSADFLLQASVREFSGCAVLEAMACGVVPVVTDIPSFRAMTGNDRFEALFPVGDADGLARAVLSHSAEHIDDYRREIRAHFERYLSFGHLAEQLDETYRDTLSRRAESNIGMMAAS